MTKRYLNAVLAVSLFLNSSCYYMASQGDSQRVLETHVTRQNEHVLNYVPIVKLSDFDLETKQLRLDVQRYPVLAFEEHRESVVGRGNFGQTAGNGTLGYGLVVLVGGLVAAGMLLPDSSGKKANPLPSSFNDATQQSLLVGAGAAGGFILLDFLFSLIQYIPSTREGVQSVTEAQNQQQAPLRDGSLLIKRADTGAVLYSGRSDEEGSLAVPIQILTAKEDASLVLTDAAGTLQPLAISLDTLSKDLSADSPVAEQLQTFAAEQSKYQELFQTAPEDRDVQTALASSQAIDARYLLPEQAKELQAQQQVWYKSQYDALVALVNGATPANPDGISEAIEAVQQLPSEMPFSRELKAQIPVWTQKGYQLTFQKAYQLAVEKNFADAASVAASVPEAATVYTQAQKKAKEWWILHYQQLYNQAYTLAAAKDFQSAAMAAVQIDKISPLYAQAQKKAKEWWGLYYHEIYLQAFRLASNGEVQAAIDQMVQIPNDAALYPQAQGKIGQWRRILADRDRRAREQAAARQQQEANRQAEAARQQNLHACDRYYPGYTSAIRYTFFGLQGSDGFVIRYVNKDQNRVTVEGTGGGGNELKYGETREFSCTELRQHE